MTFTEAHAALEAIRNLSIDRLDERQPMLVDLIADIVDEFTEGGSITAEKGNLAVECMPFWDSLHGLLYELGFHKLGNGHFSAAYEHFLLPLKVIKVGYKKEDSGAAYAAYCRMNQGKQGIPTIHDIQRHTACYTVVLDRLYPLEGWCGRDESEEIVEHISAAQGIIDCGTSLYASPKVSHAFVETCKGIRAFFKGVASFDCHTGNMMKDAQGNLIITDPVSFRSEDQECSDFQVDPDALIEEVEQVRLQAVIKRCRARKERRDPNGIFQRRRKALAKCLRVARRNQERFRKELVKNRLFNATMDKHFNSVLREAAQLVTLRLPVSTYINE